MNRCESFPRGLFITLGTPGEIGSSQMAFNSFTLNIEFDTENVEKGEMCAHKFMLVSLSGGLSVHRPGAMI